MLELIRTAYQGDVVGQTYEGNRVFDVITILDDASRDNISKIGDLPLRSPGGSYVLLKQIADIYEAAGRYQVLHEGARRVQTMTANVAGRDVPAFVRTAKARDRGESAACRPGPTCSLPARRRRKRAPSATWFSIR